VVVDDGYLYDVVTQVISRIETVFNVVIPWIVIAIASVVSLVRLLRTARPFNQTTTQPEVAIDPEVKYIRSTSIAQLCASVVFVVLSVPAHVHQLYVMLAGSQSAPVALGTYMTQRLLLVVLYSRCASTFFVHFAASCYFRRRLVAVLRHVIRCRRADRCCRGRNNTEVEISLTPTWSPGANSEHPPVNGDTRDSVEMV